jgi:hypothetical protein
VSSSGVVEVGVEVEPSTHMLQITTLPQAGVVVIKTLSSRYCIALYDVLLIL